MFAEKLRVAMQELNLNQTKLSALTGIGKPSISQYLAGKVIPSETKQRKIAEDLGLSPDYFVQEKSVMKIGDVAPIKRLRPEDAARLMGMGVKTIHIGLQDGVFPWGYAIQTSEKQWTYFINARRFAEKEGIEIT